MAKKLINLQTKDYEHPFDREALAKVEAIPFLPKVLNFYMNWAYIKWSVISLCGSNFHVTRNSCPKLYEVARETWTTLDLEHIPDLYTEQNYYINACTTGHKKDAYIILSTGAVDKLSDAELKFVVGHESGHIKSGHVLYHLLCAYLSQMVTNIPGGDTLSMPLQVALKYWNRMSEFTADRAGLLACQDLNASLSAIMKMSGLPERYYDSASIEGFILQAHEFVNKYGSTSDTIIKALELFDEDHPWNIVRAAELIRWVESGKYDEILNGRNAKTCPECNNEIEEQAGICPFCGHNFE